MKKILAIVMSLVMLLSACAFAETPAAPVGAQITLGNPFVISGEGEAAEVLLDLTGIDLGLGFCMNDVDKGAQLSLGANGQQVLALNAALGEDALLLGMTGVSKMYSLKFADMAESIGVDADAVSDLDVNKVTQKIDPADQMALLALLMEAVALVQANTIVTPEPQVIEGVSYNMTSVSVTADQLMPLVEKALPIADKYASVLENTGLESFTQLYETLSPKVDVSGVYLDAKEQGILDFVVHGTLYAGTEQAVSGYLQLYLEGAEAENMGTNMYVEATVGFGEECYTLGFDVEVSNENDGSWLPASDAPVDLITALQDETLSQQLMLEAMSAGIMALSQMAASNETIAALLGSMMGA